uniref:CDK5 regulatory subunit-associated protein 2 n=1 Tax=Molossus molossus TaxID=27622 RepID=A0A7J8EC94_MOLMO|nr:CDK5 regulatory subunit associated protein 2 [Molossus molossus]
MDSVLEEDVTLPGTLSGCSGLVPKLPDDLEGISPIAGLGNGVLPKVSEETVSPTRARNMKDFENQITELKKENFNLKLRIYFLEERMQQEFNGPIEHIYKTNIELKVEVESLKRELQEREQLLIKASKAVESLAEGGGSEVRRVKADAQKKVQQVEDLLTKRIFLLEEDVKAARAELEKACAGTEAEKALRLSLENKLSEMKKMHAGDLDMALVLEEKDRLIEELKLSLKSKEALIQCLKEEKSQMASPDENVSSGELRGLAAALREGEERETEAAQMERQMERNRFEDRIQALQEDLREKEREIATEKKNSLKRDKAIQGLTMVLKSKEKEVEELNSEIEELRAAFAKAREARQETETQKFQGSEDYEAALLEKEALLAELHSENLTKSTENHRLQRSIKKVTQELCDLQQEKERLEKDLEAAHREKSRGDCTIHDLRNEVEKLRNEVNEREKAVENRYKSLLSESNKKLCSQEQVIRCLTESTSQKDKDLLLQKSNEEDSEAIQQNRYLMTAEDLKFRSEDLITEKCSSQQSPGSRIIFSEEKQQLDYEELIRVLKKEQDIYAHLVKSLQDSDSVKNLQAELNSIFALRKQLERDVLACRNLQKMLEEQISEIRKREDEPFSFYSDQTSYLSICLEEHNRFQVEHFSQEELKKKVSDLVQLVKELYTDNQHLKKTIFDLSCMGSQGDDRLESTEQAEEAKKSRLPVLIKPSQPLGSVYRLPAAQEVVAQLQGQILELQGELKEFKIRNKQLHQKLILAEAMMERSSAPDKTLLKAQPLVGAAYQDSPGEQKGIKTTPCVWRNKERDNDQQTSYETKSEIDQPSDLAILPTCKEDPSEDFQGPTSVATYPSSKSQLSPEVSVIGTNQSKNIDTSNDTENLKQKIYDLETELEGYRNFIFQLQKHCQCSEAIITVLCGTEGAQDVSSKPECGTDEEEMTFSSLHRVHMKILHPLDPEVVDGRMLENLEQQLEEQECELQKEQNLNMELFSDIHDLQNKFRDLSPSRCNSLVQSQARELSLQRQQIKDSHGICVIYRQHMNTMIKAFEELLQASDVDYYVAEGFQEQLNQCAELLEKLEKLFLNGKSVGVERSTQSELIERVEEDSLACRHALPESPEPLASQVLSDCEMSEKSSSSQDQKQDSETEKTSVTANNFSQDLLMEHIQEIRSLRKRLEESIKTNEKLRRQLERQGSEFDQGSSNIFACGSELHNSLMSEIHFLRKQNQALNTLLAKGPRDKQKENEKLREALSRKTADLERLQRELACVEGEKERLQQEAAQRERHSQQLLRELREGRSELSRVQEESKRRQQLLSQNNKLLQSLRVELKVYEKLDVELRVPRESRAEASGEGWKGQGPPGDLHDLLTEIQALRAQLERSIDTNSTLQGRLEEQLAAGGRKAPEAALTSALQTLSTPEQPLPVARHDGDRCPVVVDSSHALCGSALAEPPRSASETPPLSKDDTDSPSCDSGSSATSAPCVSRLVPGHHLWASESGCHVLGLLEDYDALCKQIGQGQELLAEMDIHIREAPSPSSREPGTKGLHPAPPSRFVTSLSRAKLTLEEAARLLTLLWRVSLPTEGPCTLHCEQTVEMKAEITKLHKKLFEQEKKLQHTMKLLQLSKHQEKVIFDQLVVTHKILRKARGNLELRPGGAHLGACSPSRPGS